MAKFSQHKKSSRGEPFRCCKCPEPIIKDQQYYTWAFAFGSTYYQHVSHGAPRQSQLTQSKMSGVYAAVETAEETIGSAGSVEDIQSALEEAINDITSVKDEYEESLGNMPEQLQSGSTGEEIQSKVDELDNFVSELESCKDNMEEFDEDEPVVDLAAIAAWEAAEPDFDDGAVSDNNEETAEHKAWAETEPEPSVSDHDEWEEKAESHLEDRRQEALDALGNLSI